jgi:peptidoglycan/xylan/chitin deacetylase (PgdA/CDA1 family)/GT2 family glycosyltransferase
LTYCSIIIPTLARADLLSETLDSLALQTEQDFEAVVVCDGEDERTRTLSTRYIAAYPISWTFNSRNLGLPSARNIGAQRAQGKVLVFLDDDCLPVADWLLHHCAHHRRCGVDREIVILGPIYDTYVHPPSSMTEQMLREARRQNLTDFYSRCLRMGRDLSRFPECGMNSSIARDRFWASGGYDAAMHFAEDLEFGTRLWGRGARMIFEPQAIVCHRNPKNLTECHARNAELCGQIDVYRVRQKHQRTTQTEHLLALHEAKRIRKLKQRLAWQYPSAVRRIGEVCRRVADRTGSHLCFRLWSRLIAATAYWDGVKSRGVTLTSLRELIGSPLPVLMFHSISIPADRYERAHRLSPLRFRRFVRWLSDADYKSIDPFQWLSAPTDPRNVMLTFDDGYEDFYSNGFPVLQENGFSATIFVVVDRIGATNSWDTQTRLGQRALLSLQQLRELQRYGITLGSHSLTHPRLPGLPHHELRREVTDSKSRLEDLLGTEVTCFAYPYGGVDERVRAAVAEAGYKMAMTTEPGLSFWDDPLTVKRIGLSEKDLLADFLLKLRSGRSSRLDLLEQLQEALYASVYALPAPAPRLIKQAVHWLRQL